jgi:AcrR family transcriptional regulator
VLRTAMIHADETGLERFTMRLLAQVLDVAPMALYRHVANKDDLVDGMVDLVFAEVELPPADLNWKDWMRQRAIGVRQALVRHPWAIGLMESRRRPGPATLRHHDAVIGRLRGSGFSLAMAAHAYSLTDAYIYGFAMNQANLPSELGLETSEVAAIMVEQVPAEEYPHLAEFTFEHVMQPSYDFSEEFEYGLDIVLEGLGNAMGTGSRASGGTGRRRSATAGQRGSGACGSARSAPPSR